MTHTPGPWNIKHQNSYTATIWAKGNPTLAEIPERFSSHNLRNADARLIAAAPDLLAALDALHGEFMSRMATVNSCDWTPEEDEAEKAARAALAKAQQS